jgi:hypothetical protein
VQRSLTYGHNRYNRTFGQYLFSNTTVQVVHVVVIIVPAVQYIVRFLKICSRTAMVPVSSPTGTVYWTVN